MAFRTSSSVIPTAGSRAIGLTGASGVAVPPPFAGAICAAWRSGPNAGRSPRTVHQRCVKLVCPVARACSVAQTSTSCFGPHVLWAPQVSHVPMRSYPPL